MGSRHVRREDSCTFVVGVGHDSLASGKALDVVASWTSIGNDAIRDDGGRLLASSNSGIEVT